MKYQRKHEPIIRTHELVEAVSRELEEISLWTGKWYTVTFVRYTRNLRVTDRTTGISYYHQIRSLNDANETLCYYKGYAQAVYDLLSNK